MKNFLSVLAGILASLVFLLSVTTPAFAATRQVPCPLIEGVQTSPNGVKTQCVFPSTFTTTSVGTAKFNAGQATLTKFNLDNFGSRDVVATDSGKPSGNTGATDTTNPDGSASGPLPTPGSGSDDAPRPGETYAQYCERTTSNPLSELGCAITQLPSILSDMAGAFGLAAMWWTLSTSAYLFFIGAEFLMWLGTTIFDNVLYYFVVNMSVFIQSGNAKGILMGWTFIRDLMNIGIIAGFIIVGISTILQAQQYSANRFLARLIIAALLVNFSYFFAGAVIDASNFIATQIYQSKIVTNVTGPDKEKVCSHTMQQAKSLSYIYQYAGQYLVPPNKLCSISKTFTETLNLGTWSDLRTNARNNTSKDYDSNMTLFFIGAIGGFFYVTVGFVFFSASVLLLGRFIVLILLLITSPLGVAGANIPYIDEYAKKWWSILFGQAFFAPVFITLVGIGLHMIHDINLVFKKGNFQDKAVYSNIASGNFDDAMAAIPMFITFFIGVGFMYAALQISRSMSESGKEYVGGIYDALQKNVGSLYGNIYQATAGKALLLPSTVYDATVGQLARIPVIGGILGAPLIGVGKMLKQDPNGRPFGASQSNADANKSTQDYMKGLSENPLAKALWTLSDPGDAYSKLEHAIAVPFQNMIESWTGASVAALMKRDPNSLTPAQRRKIQRYVEHLSDDELAGMTSTELAEIAPYMSAKQFGKTMDRSDLNDTQRKEIQDSRWAEINKAKEEGRHDDVAKMIDNLDKTERKILFTDREDIRTDKQILAALGGKTFDEISDDSSLWVGEKGATELKGIQQYRAGEVAKKPGRMSESDAKRMTSEHISDDQIDKLTPAQARRLHQNTKDPVLRAKIVKRFPEIFGAGPSLAGDDEEEEKRKADADKKEQEDKEKAAAEEEERKKKEKADKGKGA